jgi:hypothetical protein
MLMVHTYIMYLILDILFKLRSQAENNCQLYKQELIKTNKLFDENDKKYYPVIEKMKLNEESRVSFVKYHFEKFSKIMEEHTVSACELLNRINNALIEVKIEDDVKIFEEKFNYLNKNNERIPKEEFLNYDIYRRNLERILNNNQIMVGGNMTNITNVIVNTSEDYSSHSGSTVNTSILSEEEEDSVNIFFRNLRTDENEVAMEDFAKVMEKLDGNITYSQHFIDKLLLHYKSNLYVKFQNYQNLHHMANILLTITNNTETKRELFEINFAVIYIAEKTLYINPDNIYNKVYLCKLLSKNKVYSDKKFWMDLMEIKIQSLIEHKIKLEINKKERDLDKENATNDGDSTPSNSNSLNSNSNSTSIISPGKTSKDITAAKQMPQKGGLISKMKNLFTSAVIKENKKVELSIIYTQIYDQVKSNEAAVVVKEYIPHFCNFNFDVSEAIDIIVELSSKYNYDTEKVSFFISLLNSNMFTIKNNSSKLNKLVDYTDYKTSYMNKSFKKYMAMNDQTLTIIAHSLKYLNVKDYGNILTVNKNYYKKLSKIVYQNVLLKYHNMSIAKRLEIWKSLLKIVLYIFNL